MKSTSTYKEGQFVISPMAQSQMAFRKQSENDLEEEKSSQPMVNTNGNRNDNGNGHKNGSKLSPLPDQHSLKNNSDDKLKKEK